MGCSLLYRTGDALTGGRCGWPRNPQSAVDDRENSLLRFEFMEAVVRLAFVLFPANKYDAPMVHVLAHPVLHILCRVTSLTL